METFKDNFSKQSDVYLRYRPLYPTELYDWLASLTPRHDIAWDCGTGNGQAAIGLAANYNKVIATDPSAKQIGNAILHPKIDYRIAKAESTLIDSHTVDLLTTANALHWFDFDTFYPEANRILKPGGIIAAWAYALPEISPELDAIVKNFHDIILSDYWLPENRLVENGYKTIPFPYDEIHAPAFSYQKKLKLEDLVGYLNTWSAVQRFIDRNSKNPVDNLQPELAKAWSDGSEKIFTWHLILKVGRTQES